MGNRNGHVASEKTKSFQIQKLFEKLKKRSSRTITVDCSSSECDDCECDRYSVCSQCPYCCTPSDSGEKDYFTFFFANRRAQIVSLGCVFHRMGFRPPLA